MADGIRLFVSHSAKNAKFAEAFIELIKNSLSLPPSVIRCTSVDGYRLPGGAKNEEQLREETLAADAFVGLVSPESMKSIFVAFELGAGWGADKHILPILLPGTEASVLDGPMKNRNALRADSRSQLHQIIEELGQQLNITPASPAVYGRYIEETVRFSAETNSVASTSLSSILSGLRQFTT